MTLAKLFCEMTNNQYIGMCPFGDIRHYFYERISLIQYPDIDYLYVDHCLIAYQFKGG